ncbi:hypothetical protein QG37_08092 [Candidozyma auris]|nr:hypothetical protein QG37_08092 [[Candida] auris]
MTELATAGVFMEFYQCTSLPNHGFWWKAARQTAHILSVKSVAEKWSSAA